MKPTDDIANPNTVKVIFDKNRYALYFSRYPIPFLRDEKNKNKADYYKHIGVYGYTKKFVCEFTKSKQTKLEISTLDRNGLLARIALTFARLGYQISAARITTTGERADDYFAITDINGLPLSLSQKNELSLELKAALDII